jgi:hypothetical protein
MILEQLYQENKEDSIYGRYVTLATIEPILKRLNTNNELSIIGKSVLGRAIYKYQIGNGKIKVFIWSQMHGNESTTTKALLDFINVLHAKTELATDFLSKFTFCIIPILNPDGAFLYTRVNANEIDLNRDSQDLTQPESRLLRDTFNSFKPEYCFNLHDQRTIFGVGDTGKPASVSFLAPSYNEARDINTSRLKAINLIADINDVLQQYIPDQVARFDDSFNINCIGDTFQFLGAATLLFEAGHYPNDYQREESRKFIFFALFSSFSLLNENDIVNTKIDKYLNIPQNKAVFYDFIYKNVKINYDGIEKITNFAVQYNEVLIDNNVTFNANIVEIGNLDGFFGHVEYNAEGATYRDDKNNFPQLNQKADFYLGNNVKVVNGVIKNHKN